MLKLFGISPLSAAILRTFSKSLGLKIFRGGPVKKITLYKYFHTLSKVSLMKLSTLLACLRRKGLRRWNSIRREFSSVQNFLQWPGLKSACWLFRTSLKNHFYASKLIAKTFMSRRPSSTWACQFASQCPWYPFSKTLTPLHMKNISSQERLNKNLHKLNLYNFRQSVCLEAV